MVLNEIKKITKKLPKKYLNIVTRIYKNFTNMEVLFDEENNYQNEEDGYEEDKEEDDNFVLPPFFEE